MKPQPSGQRGVQAELRAVLSLQLEVLVQMRRLLEREQKALVDDDEGAIGDLTIDKPRMLEKTIERSRALERLLEHEGLPADSEGLNRSIQRQSDAHELYGLRDRIMGEIQSCADHNRMNGAILERKRAALERALRVLVAQEQGANRYHPSGRLENPHGRGSIGSA
jgi:flagellar biosynthesis/type III secretory pathway chaperone